MRREWRSITCGGEMAAGLKAYLTVNRFRFEPSECYDKTHIRIWVNDDETDAINEWIDENY